MQMIRKTIEKEDGRILHIYHFPETASEEQRITFEQLPEEIDEEGEIV